MGRQVLVLGGGVGGRVAAEELRSLLPHDDRIVIVDGASEHVLGLSLLWVMRGWREPGDVRVAPAGLDEAGIEHVRAQVEELRLEDRRVVTSAGELAYDALVIALGAEIDLDGLPGLRKAIAGGIAGEYYTLDGATALSTRLREIDGGRICLLVSRIPFKCPAAPYEGALLIDDMLVERSLRDEVALCVISPEPHPMPVAGPVVGEALVSMLQERRIGYQPKTTVERVDAEASELVLADGDRHSFDFLVAVPPHRPPRPVREAGFSEAGWIPVDPRTLATKVPDVWALGDVSMLKLANDLPLPKAGIFAMEQAKAVAAGIAERFGVEASKPWFSGEGYCYVEVGGGKAAKGVGSFLERSGPVVHLYGASTEHHEEKAREEREWIARWAGMRGAVNAGA